MGRWRGGIAVLPVLKNGAFRLHILACHAIHMTSIAAEGKLGTEPTDDEWAECQIPALSHSQCNARCVSIINKYANMFT